MGGNKLTKNRVSIFKQTSGLIKQKADEKQKGLFLNKDSVFRQLFAFLLLVTLEYVFGRELCFSTAYCFKVSLVFEQELRLSFNEFRPRLTSSIVVFLTKSPLCGYAGHRQKPMAGLDIGGVF